MADREEILYDGSNACMIRITWKEYIAIYRLYDGSARCYTNVITSTMEYVYVNEDIFKVSRQYIRQKAKVRPKDYAVVRRFFGAKLG